MKYHYFWLLLLEEAFVRHNYFKDHRKIRHLVIISVFTASVYHKLCIFGNFFGVLRVKMPAFLLSPLFPLPLKSCQCNSNRQDRHEQRWGGGLWLINCVKMNVCPALSSTAHFIDCTPVRRSHIHLFGLRWKTRVRLTSTFSSLPFTRLRVAPRCVVIWKHPSSPPLSPRQQDRQRVIKIAPAALCLMSLSAQRSLGATSQQCAASVWPDSAAVCWTEVTFMQYYSQNYTANLTEKAYCW